MSFLRLPLEIRLNVYSQLFGVGIAYVHGGRQDVGYEAEAPNMIPKILESPHTKERSAQILRTRKAILAEARPMLYKNTTFRVSYQAFAGRLPARLTTNNPSSSHIRHLEWHLSCGLLKRYDERDVHIQEHEAQNLCYVQITCEVENWKGSFCGAWCDREVFVTGRQTVIAFAQLLRSRMSGGRRVVTLVEDVRHLSRGRVVLRLFVGRRNIGPDDLLID